MLMSSTSYLLSCYNIYPEQYMSIESNVFEKKLILFIVSLTVYKYINYNNKINNDEYIN